MASSTDQKGAGVAGGGMARAGIIETVQAAPEIGWVEGQVYVSFERPIQYIKLTADQALRLAAHLARAARDVHTHWVGSPASVDAESASAMQVQHQGLAGMPLGAAGCRNSKEDTDAAA